MTNPKEILEAAQLTGKERIIVTALAEAWPASVRTNAILDLLYGRKDGPAFLAQAIANPVRILRLKLREFGWTIPHGGKNRGYRLERIA